jgi:signal transduction histidine kinase
VRQAQKELNVLIAEMRPAALEGKGLASALREYVGRWSQGAEIPADLRVQGERETPLEVEQTLFRVAQEALTNVRKHAETDRVSVTLGHRAGGAVRLVIRDWGRGFEPTEVASGGGPGERVGLSSMRERVALLGGDLEIYSEPGEGTTVVAEVPLQVMETSHGR